MSIIHAENSNYSPGDCPINWACSKTAITSWAISCKSVAYVTIEGLARSICPCNKQRAIRIDFSDIRRFQTIKAMIERNEAEVNWRITARVVAHIDVAVFASRLIVGVQFSNRYIQATLRSAINAAVCFVDPEACHLSMQTERKQSTSNEREENSHSIPFRS
jgi:hypothetical protein